MRALRGMVVGVLLSLTGCVAYGPESVAHGYGYGSGYAYRPAHPVYVGPYPPIVVPVVRYPRYHRHHRYHDHRRWRR